MKVVTLQIIASTSGLSTSLPALDEVHRRRQEHQVAREVEAPPPHPGEPPHEQRRHLHGHEEVGRHDAPGHRPGLPGRGVGHRQLGRTPVGEGVGDQRREVHAERHRW